MAFSNGQNVQAADLNNFSVTSVTTTGDITCGDDLAVTDDATVGGDLAVTGSITMGGVPITSTVNRNICCGRLTLTSATPVTTADVTAATTLYWALYGGNQVSIYSGTEWLLFSLSELSIAVPATTNQMYDVFLNYNAGTPALSVTAWTNDTTRATALTLQDGVLVLTGTTTKRYVGSFRTTGVSGQTEDSFAKRFVWNYYNRVARPMRVTEATNSWIYVNGSTYQQANASAANQLAFVLGVAEERLSARVYSQALDAAGVARISVAVGIDSATTPTAGNLMGGYTNSTEITAITCALDVYPAVGYHFAAWLESATSGNNVTWYGDNNTTTLVQSGIYGELRG